MIKIDKATVKCDGCKQLYDGHEGVNACPFCDYRTFVPATEY